MNTRSSLRYDLSLAWDVVGQLERIPSDFPHAYLVFAAATVIRGLIAEKHGASDDWRDELRRYSREKQELERNIVILNREIYALRAGRDQVADVALSEENNRLRRERDDALRAAIILRAKLKRREKKAVAV